MFKLGLPTVSFPLGIITAGSPNLRLTWAISMRGVVQRATRVAAKLSKSPVVDDYRCVFYHTYGWDHHGAFFTSIVTVWHCMICVSRLVATSIEEAYFCDDKRILITRNGWLSFTRL